MAVIPQVITEDRASGGRVIDGSLRFDGSSHLNRTPSSAGTTTTWTFSCWLKLAGTSEGTPISAADGAGYTALFHSVGGEGHFRLSRYVGSNQYAKSTTSRYRDPSGWYHLVTVFDSTNSFADDRIRYYVNGVRLTDFSNDGSSVTNVDPGLNAVSGINSNTAQRIGSQFDGTYAFLNGYMAEVHMLDGTAVTDASYFGFTDPLTNTWRPKKVEGVTYGTNGFYLDFSDSSDIGADRSGNGNDFTASGFSADDVVPDSPSGIAYSAESTSGITTVSQRKPTNWCTLNPLNRAINNLFDGNLVATRVSGTGFAGSTGTLAASSGKWYYEVTVSTAAGMMGMVASSWTVNLNGALWWNNATGYGFYGVNGNKFNNGSNSAYGSSWSNGDVIGVAMDLDNGAIYFAVNNTWQNSGDPTSGPAATGAAYSGITANEFTPVVYAQDATAGDYPVTANFGQQPFKYAPPEGFKTLCLANLPRPTEPSVRPDKYFKVITTATDPRPNPPQVGDFIEGGYYAGRILHTDNKVYDIIVSPKEYGQSVKQYKTSNDGSTSASSRTYGKIAQDANNNANHPAFQWAAALDINGYTDWYIPAQDELNVCYRAFKPTTDSNYTLNDTAHGSNQSALPFGKAFADDGGPSQTGITSFRSGNGEDFTTSGSDPAGQTDSYPTHWSATEPSNDTASAIRIAFGNGLAASGGDVNRDKNASFLVRAIRRRYAYDGDVLNMLRDDIPDGLYWMKRRLYNNSRVDPAESWRVVDSVRGFTNNITCDTTAVENTYSASLSESAAYAWKAGGPQVTNTDGTITSYVSVSSESGVGIVTYTGTGTAGNGFGHGLGVAPKMVLIKGRSNADNWHVYHESTGNTGGMFLNLTNTFTTSSFFWNDTSPSSTVVTLSSGASNNQSGVTYVAYCFSEVPGFSKISSYTGNGSADGVFVHCGFRPAWLMVKNTDTAQGWYIVDDVRDSYNPTLTSLVTNNSDDESNGSTGANFDFLSNGFKLRSSNDDSNKSGDVYIFAAFAEAPDNNLFGGQANAR